MANKNSVSLFVHAIRIAVPAGVAVLIVLWVGGSQLLQSSVEQELRNNVTENSTSETARVQERLEGLRDFARALAGNALMINGLIDVEGRASYLPAFFRTLILPSSPEAAVFLVDFKGRVVASNVSGKDVPPVLPEAIGKPSMDVNLQELWISEPVLISGSPEGAIVIRYPASAYEKLFGASHFADTFFIVDQSGIVIHSTDTAFAATGEPAPTDAIEGRLQVRNTLTDGGLSVVVATSLDVTFEHLKTIRFLLLIGLLLFLLVFVGLIVMSIFIVSRPLKQFAMSISAIHDMEGLDRRLDTKGPREIAELATAFNTMIAKLRRATKKGQELRASRARLADIVDLASDAIVSMDQNRCISTFNKGAEKIFGYAANDVIGQPVDMLIPEAFRVTHDGHIAAFSRSPDSSQTMAGRGEISGLRKDGTVFPAEASITKLRFDEEIVFTAFLRDITKRKRAQQDLREAQKLEAVGQLAGGIAHEINTPAQYIGDNLKFLTDSHNDLFSLMDKSLALAEAARGHGDLSTMAGDVDAIREEIDFDYLRVEIPSATEQSLAGIEQVSRIVLAMKEFSHPGAREKALADINSALKNTITISGNEWKHVAEIETIFDQTLPAVSCFAGELNQVFLNLIVNAAHAIAERQDRQGLGTIKVSTETDGKYVIVRVADDGAGIPVEARDQIFNPFFTTKEVGKGTGQGLSIARDIVVKKHGGTLGFDTEIGQGTTFIVKLPIDRTHLTPTSRPAGDNGKGDSEIDHEAG